MNGYVKCFDDNKTMSFLADDTPSGLGESRKEFLKEYIKVWAKIRDLIGKKIDAEPVYPFINIAKFCHPKGLKILSPNTCRRV